MPVVSRYGFVLSLFIVLGMLTGCGGGDETPVPAKTLSWSAPSSFTDGTPLNPLTDLQDFEIYVSQDTSFGSTDQAVAVVAPADRSFNLALLAPSLSKGTIYYVSLRAVSTIGLKSNFSSPASFSF